ncbi:MAG: hypothetical protein WC785_06790 [Tatlockia sp.]|jgi:hypothetical protein
MNDKLQKSLEGLVPYLMLGIAIALVIGLFIMFSYVVVWGLLIGALLWLVSVVRTYLFPVKPTQVELKRRKGRVIEHEDKK